MFLRFKEDIMEQNKDVALENKKVLLHWKIEKR